MRLLLISTLTLLAAGGAYAAPQGVDPARPIATLAPVDPVVPICSGPCDPNTKYPCGLSQTSNCLCQLNASGRYECRNPVISPLCGGKCNPNIDAIQCGGAANCLCVSTGVFGEGICRLRVSPPGPGCGDPCDPLSTDANQCNRYVSAEPVKTPKLDTGAAIPVPIRDCTCHWVRDYIVAEAELQKADEISPIPGPIIPIRPRGNCKPRNPPEVIPKCGERCINRCDGGCNCVKKTNALIGICEKPKPLNCGDYCDPTSLDKYQCYGSLVKPPLPVEPKCICQWLLTAELPKDEPYESLLPPRPRGICKPRIIIDPPPPKCGEKCTSICEGDCTCIIKTGQREGICEKPVKPPNCGDPCDLSSQDKYQCAGVATPPFPGFEPECTCQSALVIGGPIPLPTVVPAKEDDKAIPIIRRGVCKPRIIIDPPPIPKCGERCTSECQSDCTCLIKTGEKVGICEKKVDPPPPPKCGERCLITDICSGNCTCIIKPGAREGICEKPTDPPPPPKCGEKCTSTDICAGDCTCVIPLNQRTGVCEKRPPPVNCGDKCDPLSDDIWQCSGGVREGKEPKCSCVWDRAVPLDSTKPFRPTGICKPIPPTDADPRCGERCLNRCQADCECIKKPNALIGTCEKRGEFCSGKPCGTGADSECLARSEKCWCEKSEIVGEPGRCAPLH
ncbi:hypothetical protein EX30DRAFT_344888, partial [Ascodesmis nigricans]